MLSSSLGHYCVCLEQVSNTIVYVFIKFRTLLFMIATLLHTILYISINFWDSTVRTCNTFITLFCMLPSSLGHYCVCLQQF